MGLYDEVRWDATLPEGHPPDDRIFQTKSLDPGLEQYVVTAEGRLLLVGNGWQDEALEQPQPLQGIDVEFHGDIRIVSLKSQSQYLVRFTHGTLEWIRPLAGGEPWDSVAIASMKFYARRKDSLQHEDEP